MTSNTRLYVGMDLVAEVKPIKPPRFTDFPIGVVFLMGNGKAYRRTKKGLVVRCRSCIKGLVWEQYLRRDKRRFPERYRLRPKAPCGLRHQGPCNVACGY